MLRAASRGGEVGTTFNDEKAPGVSMHGAWIRVFRHLECIQKTEEKGKIVNLLKSVPLSNHRSFSLMCLQRNTFLHLVSKNFVMNLYIHADLLPFYVAWCIQRYI